MFLSYFRSVFTLDKRSLALYRVMLGLCVALDALQRLPDSYSLYSDVGVLPRYTLIRHDFYPWRICIYYLTGNGFLVGVLLLVHAIVGLLLAAGYRTRLQTLLAFLFTMSIHNRLPLVINGGDQWLRLMLFYGMFLPLGAVCSVDAIVQSEEVRGRKVSDAAGGVDSARDDQKNKEESELIDDDITTEVFSVPAIVTYLQMAHVYVFTVFVRTDDWWRGEALRRILYADAFATPASHIIRPYMDSVFVPLTIATMYWEMCGPLLFLLTPAHSVWRLLVVASFVAMHLSIAALMWIGLFSMISVAAWCAFVPACVWDALPAPSVAWRERLRTLVLSVVPTQSAASAPPLARSGPRRLDNHSHCCNQTRLRSIAIALFVSVCYSFSVLYNACSLNFDACRPVWPEHRFAVLSDTLRLDETWRLFHSSHMVDTWIVIEGRLQNGRVVDVRRNGRHPVEWTRPPSLLTRYRNRRWARLESMLTYDRPAYRWYRYQYAVYMARRWNEARPFDEQLTLMTVWQMASRIGDRGEPLEPTKRLVYDLNNVETMARKASLDVEVHVIQTPLERAIDWLQRCGGVLNAAFDSWLTWVRRDPWASLPDSTESTLKRVQNVPVPVEANNVEEEVPVHEREEL